MNPEYYTAWNERKLAINILSTDKFKFDLAKELYFNVATIKVNPKCYPNWQHRRWLLQSFAKDEKNDIVPGELELISKLLRLDSRNCTSMMLGQTYIFSSRMELSDMACWICGIACC